MSLIVVGWKLVQAYTGQHTVDYTKLHWKKNLYIYTVYMSLNLFSSLVPYIVREWEVVELNLN